MDADPPVLVAAVGPDEANLWPTLRAHVSDPGRTHIDEPGLRFAAAADVQLEPVRGGWCWGRHLDERRKPTSPLDAAHHLGLAGLWWDGHVGQIHTSGLGFQNIYAREVDGTTYLSNRIAPLASVGPSLTVDWDAWALFLSTQMFSHDDTGFVEIRRLPLGARLEFGEHLLTRRVIEPPPWMVDPHPNPSPADVWDALESAVRPRLGHAVDLTLSGGLDSRLLLAVLHRRRSTRLTAWTTHGVAGDFEYAQSLAAGRVRKHHLIEASADDWPANFDAVTRQLEHQTSLHTWIRPLALAMAERNRPLYDGLAGDVTLQRRALVGHPPAVRAWLMATQGMWAREGAFLSEPFRRRYADRIQDKWVKQGDAWVGHRAEVQLRRLTTRTVRGIAHSPFTLFGQSRPVITPFADPRVMSTALGFPASGSEPVDHRLAVLDAFAPQLNALPSTARHGAETFTTANPVHAARSLAHLVATIQREPAAVTPLDPALVDRMANSDFAQLKWVERLLTSTAVFADWLGVWRSRLRNADQLWT